MEGETHFTARQVKFQVSEEDTRTSTILQLIGLNIVLGALFYDQIIMFRCLLPKTKNLHPTRSVK